MAKPEKMKTSVKTSVDEFIKRTEKPPIVITAFGTTTRALDTYAVMGNAIEKQFSCHKILWAYSSRMIKDYMTKKGIKNMEHPDQILEKLEAEGCKWAVVQSLHLICGHEFYRLIEEVKQKNIRTSIGLPLLTGYRDYKDVVNGLGRLFGLEKTIENQAVVFVGHGTDHPAWSSYMALSQMFYEKFGKNIYVGVVEGLPEKNKIINAVAESKITKVILIPLMLVAGRHLMEDIAGEKDSWKTAFEQKGIFVSIKSLGLGMIPAIQQIFCRHISEAYNMISF